MLRAAGADVWRVGFNAGDRAFWFGGKGYIPYRGGPEDWADTFKTIVADKNITDIVLYGDTRPIHADAVTAARELGLKIHVFEEGYMRPFWVTYERDGTNGHSKLMDTSVQDMRAALARTELRRAGGAGPLGRHAPPRILRRAVSLVRDVSKRRIPQIPSATVNCRWSPKLRFIHAVCC